MKRDPQTLQQFTPQLFTILRSGQYTKAMLRADILSGLTVAVVALPLAMALAIASGASPDKGLITAVIAGFLISFLGGSRVQIGGPTGAFVVVIFHVIAQHGYDGLLIATFMAGIILLIAGYARFGQVIKYIPMPVVTGFTTGIAVIIASSQVKDFLGLDLTGVPADFIPKWIMYVQNMGSTDLITVVVGMVCLFLIIGLRKFVPKAPVYLVAIVLSSLFVFALGLPVDTIGSRYPDIPKGLPMPRWPEFSYDKVIAVLPSAFTIAFLAGIEALLTAVVADGMTGFRHRSNQELVGQGVANIVSSCFAGLPATGAIARTATNVRSGGRSPISGMFHAIFLLLFMLVASDIMKFVPMAALAAILFVVAWGMSEIHRFAHIMKLAGSDRIVLLLTFSLTVLVDLTVAIGIGVSLASLLFIAQMSKSVQIGVSSRTSLMLDTGDEQPEETALAAQRDPRFDLPEGVEVFHISGPIFFGVASELLDTLKRMGQMPKILIIRMNHVPFLDMTGAEAIEAIVKQCRAANTEIIFSAVQAQPRQMLEYHHVSEDDAARIHYATGYANALEIARRDLLGMEEPS